MRGDGREREALGLVAGFAIWSLAFALLYGAHGLACGLGIAPAATRTALLVLLGAHVAVLGWLVGWLLRRFRSAQAKPLRFVRGVSLALAIGAAGATLWIGLPVAALAVCA